MTPKEAAQRLDGGEYRNEGSRELFAEMKAAGLVALYGASDDLMEFNGAIHDEVGAWDGGTAYLTRQGLLQNDCDDDACPHFKRLQKQATPLHAKWDVDGFSWVYETAIPHETFVINEDGEPYCRGIVFALAHVPSP